MISRGDESARNAFCAALREETPLPLAVNVTQELDALDILEVQDVADAIARAEQSKPSLSRSRRDIFDLLGRDVPTDDASGPAVHAPVIPMPAATQPMLDASEDAYYHPGGRVRSLADATLDGSRPDLSRALGIQRRRRAFGWIVVALLVPLSALAATAVLAKGEDAPPPVRAPIVAPAKVEPAKAEPAKAEPAKAEPAKVEPAKAEPAKVEPAKAEPASVEPAKSEVPTFDVNSLPSAKTK
jgi:hypothetical protein